MKILKMIKSSYGHYYVVFDQVPEITYEKKAGDYIGSAVDSDGDIIASHYLMRERFGNAFAGREITLKMKDGSEEKIKDYWFDHGSYKGHGEFMSIGAGVVEDLQRCYVYHGYNINKTTFGKMVEDYYSREKLYEYYEVEQWCKLQHEWHDVFVNGKKIPYMMNKFGDMVEKETKKRVSARYNVVKRVNGSFKTFTFFKFEYKEGKRLIKIQANYLDTLKETLPFDESEIKVNCKIS